MLGPVRSVRYPNSMDKSAVRSVRMFPSPGQCEKETLRLLERLHQGGSRRMSECAEILSLAVGG